MKRSLELKLEKVRQGVRYRQDYYETFNCWVNISSMTEEVMVVPTKELERLTYYYMGQISECFIEQSRTIVCRTTFDLETSQDS